MAFEVTTPTELARELNVRAQGIRDFLRSRYGTLDSFTSRWHLTRAQADEVRAHFAVPPVMGRPRIVREPPPGD